MAERDQAGRLFGRLDSGHSRDGKHIPLGKRLGLQQAHGGRSTDELRLRDGTARHDRLPAHIHHVRLAAGIHMRKLLHKARMNSASVPAARPSGGTLNKASARAKEVRSPELRHRNGRIDLDSAIAGHHVSLALPATAAAAMRFRTRGRGVPPSIAATAAATKR